MTTTLQWKSQKSPKAHCIMIKPGGARLTLLRDVPPVTPLYALAWSTGHSGEARRCDVFGLDTTDFTMNDCLLTVTVVLGSGRYWCCLQYQPSPYHYTPYSVLHICLKYSFPPPPPLPSCRILESPRHSPPCCVCSVISPLLQLAPRFSSPQKKGGHLPPHKSLLPTS